MTPRERPSVRPSVANFFSSTRAPARPARMFVPRRRAWNTVDCVHFASNRKIKKNPFCFFKRMDDDDDDDPTRSSSLSFVRVSRDDDVGRYLRRPFVRRPSFVRRFENTIEN